MKRTSSRLWLRGTQSVNPWPLVSLCCWLVAVCYSSGSAAAASSEYELKAALIAKLIKFIEWPAISDDSVREFCILGQNPFDGALATYLSQTDFALAKSKDSTPKILHIPALGAVTNSQESPLKQCQALFLSGGDSAQVLRIARDSGTNGMLTISDQPMFAEQGGMIHLALERRRVKFRINQQSVENNGLKVSYKLLRLAEIVNTGTAHQASAP